MAQPALMDRALRGSEPRWPRRPLLDVAGEMIGLPAARARTGATGRGAAVCVVDTGLDLAHPDFRDGAGGTRVSWMLDLASPPRAGVSPDVAALQDEHGGAVWSAAEIDAADSATLPRDTHGHGTAVASAAAGDDPERGGVAPEASLLAVNVLRPDVPGFYDDDLVTGARFCARVGPPGRTVIVIAAGGHDGAHDGTEPLELALAEIVRAGTPVVVAAGNEGDVAVHASGLLAPREERAIPLRVPAPPRSAVLHHLALVLTVRDGSDLRVALEAPDGARTPSLALGERVMLDTPSGQVTIDATRPARANGDRPIYALLAGGGELPRPVAGGTWRLHVRGPGRFDAWIADDAIGATIGRARFDGPDADSRESVSIPATAREVIAVGAVSSRPMFEGRLVEPGAVAGEPAPYTAVGPTRVGAPKPDLVAPGGYVVVALSADVAPGDPQNLVGGSAALLDQLRFGGNRIVLSGTSFAAPLAAGALALAFGVAPHDPDDHRLLVATGRPIGGHAWDPAAGAGMLDVDAFLAARGALSLEPVDADGVLASATRLRVAQGEPFWIVVRASDASGVPLAAAEVELRPGGHAPLRAELRAGVAWIPASFRGEARVEVDGVSAGAVRVRPDEPSFHPIGGGCATSGRPAAPWTLPAAIFLVVLGNRRRA